MRSWTCPPRPAHLRPHYEAIEAELPVSGQDWPRGDPHRSAHHAHPVSGNGESFLRGREGSSSTAYRARTCTCSTPPFSKPCEQDVSNCVSHAFHDPKLRTGKT
jgi:hypothetical protein